MCNVIIAFKLKQNSHMWIRVINFPTQQEREKIEVGMDGFTSKKEPWEWAWTVDSLSLLIFITIRLSSSLHLCLIRYPQILMGTIWLPSLVLNSLGLCNWSSLSQLRPILKWYPWSEKIQCRSDPSNWRLSKVPTTGWQSFMLNPPDVSGFPPSR